MPKVSVIIPVYNVEKYLHRCLDSVISQSERDIEIILVDDGSTDSSSEICSEYARKDSRIKLLRGGGKGPGGSRSLAIDTALGDFFMFVDSDDYFEPETVGKALQKQTETGADIVAFGFRSVTPEGAEVSLYFDDIEKNRLIVPAENPEVLFTTPSIWNKLYKASLFRESGIRYPERVWYEDVRTTLKLYLFSKNVLFMDYIGYNYVLSGGSITRNEDAEKNRDVVEALKDIIEYFRARGEFERYYQEICYLTVLHVLLLASVRVIGIDAHHRLLGEFLEFTQTNFPDYRKNKYLGKLSKKQRIILKLIEKKQYSAVRLIFKLKGSK